MPVRPAVIGNSRAHDIKALYLGWAGDGHFGRININHAFYQVLGKDSFNSLSGDANPQDGTGRGFDTILDIPFFAGGQFSYWNSQKIRLLGVNLTSKLSLVPNLRSSKTEGQANFVNPGLLLLNLGYDAELTPKVKLILNANYLRFAHTASLASFINQAGIGNDIGFDYGIGILYRPFLNNNARFTFSLNALTPLSGFQDLYDSSATQFSLSTSLVFTY